MSHDTSRPIADLPTRGRISILVAVQLSLHIQKSMKNNLNGLFRRLKNATVLPYLSGALYVLSVVLSGEVIAQETDFEVSVCTRNAIDSGPINGVAVEGRIREQNPATATTGVDGCAVLAFEVLTSTNITEDVVLPEDFHVDSPYPNPALNEVNIPLRVKRTQRVELMLYDVAGRSVMPAFAVVVPAGKHYFDLDMAGLYAGLYIYRVVGEYGRASGKIVKTAYSSGSTPRVLLISGINSLNRTPAGRFEKAEELSALTVRLEASKPGYDTVRIEQNVEDEEKVVLEMNKLATDSPAFPLLLAPADGATGVSTQDVDFVWTHVDGAVSYDVQLSTQDDFSSIEQGKQGIADTTLLLTGLSAETSYFWRVRSNNEGGTSEWSARGEFSTGQGGVANGMIALDLVGPADTYYGLPGGLVDNGIPTVTPTNGKIVIIAISMSNGFLEFERFIELYENHPEVNAQVELVNCAVSGNALERWVGEEGQELWERCKNNVMRKHGLNQVKVVWAKNANQFTEAGITLPDPQADFFNLVTNIGLLGQKISQEFPSVQAIFHSSRIYAGYVNERKQAARGEPISYEGGYAVNAVIEKWQRNELPGTPWMGWGPYLWANGLTPNDSGIFWERSDFRGQNGDDPHPSEQGTKKVADALHAFFMQFGWYGE